MINGPLLQVFNIQETIEKMLRATGRENVDELLKLMQGAGYYNVGCNQHHKGEGGLAQHSLEVLLRMQRQNDFDLPTDSIIVVALLHDLCKVNCNTQIRNQGLRSVITATQEAGFQLNLMEHQAILWHMHGRGEKGKLGSAFDAVLDNPLWKLLRKAKNYSAEHPMTEDELQFVMGGKSRILRSVPVSHCSAEKSESSPSNRQERYVTPEEKRRRKIRNNNASVAEIFDALSEHGYNVPKDVQYAIYQRFESNLDNKGFKKEFLLAQKDNPEIIERHRTMLMDCCQRHSRAAGMTSRYICEHADVFDLFLPYNEMYDWLKSEFSFNAELDNFYKYYKPNPYPNNRI